MDSPSKFEQNQRGGTTDFSRDRRGGEAFFDGLADSPSKFEQNQRGGTADFSRDRRGGKHFLMVWRIPLQNSSKIRGGEQKISPVIGGGEAFFDGLADSPSKFEQN